MRKALFITFEGGEGVGKTTLIKKLETYFSEKKITYISTREPGGTPLGEEIRNLILHKEQMASITELCLYLASRAEHVDKVIKPALIEQKTVLCDRFNDSTIAYQGAARGLDKEVIKHFCAFVSQDVEPDITFFLDLSAEEGLKRKKGDAFDRLESESLEFHKKLREEYLKLAKEHPGRIHVIDASNSPEEVFSTVIDIIRKI